LNFFRSSRIPGAAMSCARIVFPLTSDGNQRKRTLVVAQPDEGGAFDLRIVEAHALTLESHRQGPPNGSIDGLLRLDLADELPDLASGETLPGRGVGHGQHPQH